MERLRFEPVSIQRAPVHMEKTIKGTTLAGKLKAGDRFPTEKEIPSQFSVSLGTLREALRALETSGVAS